MFRDITFKGFANAHSPVTQPCRYPIRQRGHGLLIKITTRKITGENWRADIQRPNTARLKNQKVNTEPRIDKINLFSEQPADMLRRCRRARQMNARPLHTAITTIS